MEVKDFGKIATCGVNGDEVIVSKYNYKCPCLNCVNCMGEQSQCMWKYVLETNPCTNDEIQAIVCQNCIKKTKESENQRFR